MIIKRATLGDLLGLIIAYWAVSASFFSLKIPVLFSLAVVLVFIGILILPSSRYVKDGKLLLACLLILLPYMRYYRLLNPGDWYSALVYPAMVMFIYYSPRFEKWVKNLFDVLSIGYFIYAVFTVAMLFSSSVIQLACALFPSSASQMMQRYMTGRFCGLTNHYSTNGMLLAVGLLFCGCKFIQKKSIWNTIQVVLFLVALLLNGKRGNPIYGLFALVVVFYYYFSNRKKSRVFYLVAIIVLILLIVTIIIQYVPALAVIFNRFEALENSGDVSNGRFELWELALNEFEATPIFGMGWGQYRLNQKNGWDAHNVYVQLLSETGIIGFVSYIAWFLWFLYQSIVLLVQVRTSVFALSKYDELYLMF